MLKSIIKSMQKSKGIQKISKIYAKKDSIARNEIATGNNFFDVTELEENGKEKFFDLIHKTSSLNNIVNVYEIGDETLLGIQDFLYSMGAAEYVKGHYMTVSPFFFTQTLDYLLRHKDRIRSSQEFNMIFYYTLRQWFATGSNAELEDIAL